MKILSLTTSESNGGAAIVACNLASYMQTRGYDVQLLSQDSFVGSHKMPFARSLLKGYYRSRRLISRFIGCIDDDKSPIYSSYSVIPSRIVSLIREINPDIVHLHWIQGEFISLEQLALINLPIVWTLHDAWPFTCNSKHHILKTALDPRYINFAPRGIVSRLMASRKKKAINQSDITFVAPSDWMHSIAKASSIPTNPKLKLIPNGLNLNVFKPMPRSQRYSFDAHTGARQSIVLLVSSLASPADPVKGFDLFLNAIRLLQARDYSICLVIMGKSYNVSLPGIKIVRTGCVVDSAELAKIYNSVDVTCLPSRIETHSQTACESIACGTPVAAFNAAGNASIVSDGLTGYLAHPYDELSFAKAILNCISLSRSESSRNLISQKANIWDLASVSQAYISLYHEIISIRDNS